jgi:hypothetical protein
VSASFSPHLYIEFLQDVFAEDGVPSEVVSAFALEVSPQGCELITSALQGRSWTEVTTEEANSVAPYLACLTTQSLAYYLPAFLAASAMDLQGDAATYIVYAVVPLGQLEAFYTGTCSLFSHEQAEAICHLLTVMSTHPTFGYFADEIPQGLTLWKRRAHVHAECFDLDEV